MTDSLELHRVVDAQAPVYAQVMSELRSGRKRSHWMWFIFPQIAGLGHSAMARRSAIASRGEALVYLELSLSETQSCWQLISNRAMLLPYARGL
jgi:uncharacterized protein (DUF1810 family)